MTQEALKKMQWHVLTQAQYDALETKNPNDVYAIVDDKGDYTETKLNKMIFNVMSADTYKALETKDPNQIYYATGKNNIIEHKSWTDGSQNSVTPAGFQDCGFRYYSYSNAEFTNHDISNLDSDNTMLYNALLSSNVYLNTDNAVHGTVKDWITETSFKGQYLVTKVLIPKEGTIDLNSFYYFKYVMTRTSDSSTAMKSIVMQVAFVDYDSDGNVNYVRSIRTEYIDNDKLLDFSNLGVSTFAYYNPGSTAIMAVGLATDSSVCTECSFNTRAYNMPIFTQTSSTVAAAKADYEAITAKITARGNTITSLNTQGQNLVTAYNNLADKYNTAGIIVTED